MATALRHAARRIQSAAEAVERRLSTGLELTPDQRKDALIRLALIEGKKEELYNQIAAWEAEYSVEGRVGYKNTLLLKQLSAHVKPRPDDPRWRSCRRSVYYNDFLKFAGAVFIGKMAGDALSQYKGK